MKNQKPTFARIFVTCLYVSAFVFTGCSKEEAGLNVISRDKDQISIGQARRAELLKLSPDQQRVTFGTFAPEVQSYVWKFRMSQVLSQKWTKEQEQHLLVLYSYLTPELFRAPNQDDGELLNEWIGKAKQILPKELAFALTYLDDLPQNSSSNGRTEFYELPMKPSCKCSISWDYCGTFSTCRAVSGGCDDTARGCGTFWLYKCTGRCQF